MKLLLHGNKYIKYLNIIQKNKLIKNTKYYKYFKYL